MDLPVDNFGLAEADLDRVYRYAAHPQPTTVIRFMDSQAEPELWSLSTRQDWNNWLLNEVPAFDAGKGLLLILALRAGETETVIQQIETRRATFGQERADEAFKNSHNEKRRSYRWPIGKQLRPGPNASSKHEASPKGAKGSERAGRELRHMPFDKETFSEIGRKFFVHGSISRAVSRANVPLFSRLNMGISVQDCSSDEDTKSKSESKSGSKSKSKSKVKSQNKHDVIVYNCRSANTWGNDLALTATYFNQSQLTYGILLGCTADIERRVLNRVSMAKEQGFHPLLLAGAFSELERERLIEVVDSTIDRIEEAIFDLDSRNSALDEPTAPAVLIPGDDGLQHPDGERYTKRTAWLNTTFLRNRLEIWKRQVLKMIEHVYELCTRPTTDHGGSPPPVRDVHCPLEAATDADRSFIRTSNLIKERLHTLVEELDEKIEDCTMRVEGMAMATQWAQGDTNMDIARAVGRDSSQMRSISLVTMVFLPGTFLATVFSMTFFNWDASGATVSAYIWIYILVAVIFTFVTLVAWWYFLIRRQKQSRVTDTPPRNWDRLLCC